MAELKDTLYEKICSNKPADTLTKLVKYSSKRYADFLRKNGKIL